MAALIIVLVVLFCGMPLIKACFHSVEEDAPIILKNVTKSASNASYALPTMGASFSAQTTADSLSEVPELKKKLGCDDPSIITMSQLQAWMIQNNMF